MSGAGIRYDTVVLDVDGTLVDTVYQHVVIWAEAFAAYDVHVPLWRIHRAIGMGGDRLVTEVAGEDVERDHGDDIRGKHDEQFDKTIDEIRALPGAERLVQDLRRRKLTVLVASSGQAGQTERLLDLVGGARQADALTTSADVETSKPAPDVVEVALARVGKGPAVVVGDTVWDVQAARDGGHYAVGLLSGGFSEAELREAGADRVFSTTEELRQALDDLPLRTSDPGSNRSTRA
jgi:HAD superfamily hydrolase (TIGR01509 family)